MTRAGQISFRLAAIAALAAALAVAGCGRKGPLEPPPSSQAVPTDGTPAPSTQNKRIPLDVLLD